MKRDLGTLLTAVVALAFFAVVTAQTVEALHASGAWSGIWRSGGSGAVPATADPFGPLADLLQHPQPVVAPEALRDPFALGAAPVAISKAKPVPRKPVAPPPPPKPVLTAIVWDNDPRAIVHWQGRDWTIRAGGLFDEFQVLAITRTQVTLSRGSETIVLQRRPQGD